MKRLSVGLVILWAGLSVCSSASQAAARRNPPRYERGTYFPTIVQQRNGQIVTRKVYPGYKSHFPPPAWLYYGYPHSGDGLVSPGF